MRWEFIIVSYSSSSSSTVGFFSGEPDLGDPVNPVDRAAPSAALRFCVDENFSPKPLWSMLALCFLSGLPINPPTPDSSPLPVFRSEPGWLESSGWLESRVPGP